MLDKRLRIRRIRIHLGSHLGEVLGKKLYRKKIISYLLNVLSDTCTLNIFGRRMYSDNGHVNPFTMPK